MPAKLNPNLLTADTAASVAADLNKVKNIAPDVKDLMDRARSLFSGGVK